MSFIYTNVEFLNQIKNKRKLLAMLPNLDCRLKKRSSLLTFRICDGTCEWQNNRNDFEQAQEPEIKEFQIFPTESHPSQCLDINMLH